MKRIFNILVLLSTLIGMGYAMDYDVEEKLFIETLDQMRSSGQRIPKKVFSTMLYDDETETLHITDTCQMAQQSSQRSYRIHVHTRHTRGNLYHLSGQGFNRFQLGWTPKSGDANKDNYEIESRIYELEVDHDGDIALADAIRAARKQGCSHLFITIEPEYVVGGKVVSPYYSYSDYMVNLLEIQTSAIKICMEAYRMPDNIRKNTFHYQDSIEVRTHVESSLPFIIRWQTSSESEKFPVPTRTWITQKEGPYTAPKDYYDCNISWIAEADLIAGDSTTLTALANEYNNNSQSKYTDAYGWSYKMLVEQKLNLRFAYPVKDLSGNVTYHHPGEQVVFADPTHGDDCSQVHVSNYHYNLNTLTDPQGNIRFTMPAEPVHYEIYTPQYTVTFLDYNGNVLKEQLVGCGDDATAPVIRTADHPGLTFTGWVGDYSAVRANTHVYASYAELASPYFNTCDIHISRGSKTRSTRMDQVMVSDTLKLSYDIRANSTERGFSLKLRYRYDNEKTWRESLIQGCNNLKATTGIQGVYNYRLVDNEQNANRESISYQLMVVTNTNDTVWGAPYCSRMTYPVDINTNYDIYVAYADTVEFIHPVGGSAHNYLPVAIGDTVRFTSPEKKEACLTIHVNSMSTDNISHDKQGRPVYIGIGSSQACDIEMEHNRVVFKLNGGQLVDDEGVALTDTAILKQDVWCTEDAIDPGQPQKKGYYFCGWDRSFNNVNEDLTISAQWCDTTLLYHTVNFYYPDSTTLRLSCQVADGQNANEPYMQALEKDGHIYQFDHWDGELSNVTENRDIYAVYTEIIVDGLQNIPADILSDKKGRKIMVNGRLYILHGGHIYNALGGLIQATKD